MAVTDQQKLDFLLKKIGYTKTKTGNVDGTGNPGEGSVKQPFAEAIPSPLVVPNSSLWNEADSIPATPPGSDTTQVKVYSASSAVRLTEDITVSTASQARSWIAYSTYNNTSSARLTNWIDTQFGAGYLIKVYNGDPNSGGTPLSAGATNQNWFFDYSAGVLNFNDDTCPVSPSDSIYIVGYRYIGQTGAPTSGISTFSFKDLTVERNLDVGPIGGISTFRNSINALDIIKGYKYLAAPYSGTTTTFTVTVASKVSGQHRYHGQGSGLGYVIDGYQSPFFTLTPGNTYRFDQSDNSNGSHQIKFYLEADKTTLYEEGVTYNGTAGSSGAYTQIVVSDKTPVVLHYQCINHGYMGNAFQTNANVVNTNYEATIRSGLNVSGVSTFADDITVQKNMRFGDSPTGTENLLSFGAGNDLSIFHSGNGSFIRDSGTGSLTVLSNNFLVRNAGNNEELIEAFENSSVSLFFNGIKRLSTTGIGASVLGQLEVNNGINVTSGVSTFTGAIDANGDLDVDGHTNLDNVSIAGVTTFANNINGTNATLSGNINAVDGIFSGNVSIGGTLTYEDVTNIDSVGIVTARAGLKVLAGGADIVGVVTATGADINGDLDVSGQASLSGFTTTTSYGLTTRDLYTTGITTVFKSLHVNGRYANNDGILPFVVTHGGYQGIQTSKFTATLNNYPELVLENTWGGNWNTTGPWRLKWTSPNEPHAGPVGDGRTLAELMPAVSNPGALNGFRLRATDGSTGLKNVFLLKPSQSSFYVTDSSGTSEALRINTTGIGITNYIYHYGNIPNDTNTRFGFAGNGNIAFDTDGTQRFRIQNSASTFFNNIVASADLDVDGHTNLDNVSIAGVTTFSNTVHVGTGTTIESNGQATFTGITTFHKNIKLPNASGGDTTVGRIQLGDGPAIMELYHYNNNNYFTFTANQFIRGDAHGRTIHIQPKISQNGIEVIPNGAVELYYSGTKRLETTAQGIEVTGHSELDNVNIVGVTTHEGHVLPSADSTYDLGSSTKYWRHVYADNIGVGTDGTTIGVDIVTRNLQVNGISTHVGIATFNDATFHGDLDVDGHTNLDNVSIAGVTTVANNTEFIFGTNSTNTDLPLKIKHQTSNTRNQVTGKYIDFHVSDARFRDIDNGNHIAKFFHSKVVLCDGNGNDRLETKNGGIEVTGLTDTDTFLSSGNATFNGTITAGGATGTNGQYLKSTGSGVAWASFPTARTSQVFTASSGDTTFSFNYTVGLVDVFVNGIKLSTSEFTATNGSSVVLAVGCFVGDIVEILSYNVATGGGGGGTLSNIVEDTTPQLGGNLDLFNKTINGTGNINITGVATATKFVGDGSGLTGVIASGTGIIIKNSGSTVGTAGTINFGDNLSVSALSGGAVTVSASAASTAEVRANTLTVAGISTFSDDIQIPFDNKKLIVGADDDLELFHTGGNSIIKNTTSGSLLIHGNTIDLRPTTESGEVMLRATRNGSVELRHDNVKKFETRTGGVTVSGSVNATGGSFTGNLRFSDNVGTLFGASDELQVFHNNGTSYISHNGSGQLQLRAKATEHGIKIFPDGAVELYHDNIKRFETTSQGINVIGHSELDNVNIAGVVTATTFKGALQGTSGTFSSNVDITGDLDVDGHTDLDNVSVVGMITATNTSSGVGLKLIDASNKQFMAGGGGGGTPFCGSFTGHDFRIQVGGIQNAIFKYTAGATGNLELGPSSGIGITFNGSTGNAGYAGIITASKFVGDGSELTGITASGSGVVIKHDGSTVGTAGTINFSTNLDVSAISAGIVTVTASGGGGSATTINNNADNRLITGSGTANTLEAESGLTFNGTTLSNAGSGFKEIQVAPNTNNSATLRLRNSQANYTISNVTGGSFSIADAGGTRFTINSSGTVGINNDLDVDGHTNLDNVSVAGVVTATTFVGALTGNATSADTIDVTAASNSANYFVTFVDQAGAGRSLRGDSGIIYNPSSNNLAVSGAFSATDVTATGDLDVDGHTNLDNVSIVGVCTATSFVGDGSGLTGVSDNVGITTNLSGTFTASAGSPSTINTFGYGSGDIVVEYTVFIKNGSNFQSQKLLAMRDGTTIHSTQFAVMFSSSLLVQLDATISGSNILLRATPETGVSGSTTYKIKREVM